MDRPIEWTFFILMGIAVVSGTVLFTEEHRASHWYPTCIGEVALRYPDRVMLQPVDWHVVLECEVPPDMGTRDVSGLFQTYLDAEKGRTASYWQLVGDWTGLTHGEYVVVYE